MGDSINLDIVAKLVDEASGPMKGITDSIGQTAAGVALGQFAFQAAQEAISDLGNAMKSVITDTAELGEQTYALSEQTGMTAEQSSSLIAVFEHFGVDASAVSKDLGLFAKQIVAAGDGSKTAAANFTALGINVKNSNGTIKDTQDVLLEVADSFEKMPDGAEKTAEAMKLFGRSGKDMLPILNEGSAGIEALEEHAKSMGVVLSGDNVAAIHTNMLAQQDMQEAITGVELTIGNKLMPMITTVTEAFTRWASSPAVKKMLSELIDFISGNVKAVFEWLSKTILPILIDSFKGWADIITTYVMPPIKTMVNAVEGFINKYPQLKSIIPIIAAIGLAFAISPMATILIGIGLAAEELKTHWTTVKTVVSAALQQLKGPFDNFVKSIQPILDIAKALGISFINDVVKPILNLAITIGTQLLPALWNLWNALEPVLMPILKALAIIIGVVFVAALFIAMAAIHAIAQVLLWIVDVISIVINGVALFINILTGNFKQIPNDLKGALSNIVDIFTSPFRDAFSWIKNGVSDLINSVTHSLSSFNPLKSIQGELHSLHVPGFATGTHNFSGGAALVGEHGPELIQLPAGANVIPAGQFSGSGGGGTVTVNNYLNTAAAVNQMFQKLGRSQFLSDKGLASYRSGN